MKQSTGNFLFGHQTIRQSDNQAAIKHKGEINVAKVDNVAKWPKLDEL